MLVKVWVCVLPGATVGLEQNLPCGCCSITVQGLLGVCNILRSTELLNKENSLKGQSIKDKV